MQLHVGRHACKQPSRGTQTQAKEPVEIEVKLNVGTNWRITARSHDFEKKDAATILFRVTVKPEVEEKITYTLQRNW